MRWKKKKNAHERLQGHRSFFLVQGHRSDMALSSFQQNLQMRLQWMSSIYETRFTFVIHCLFILFYFILLSKGQISEHCIEPVSQVLDSLKRVMKFCVHGDVFHNHGLVSFFISFFFSPSFVYLLFLWKFCTVRWDWLSLSSTSYDHGWDWHY